MTTCSRLGLCLLLLPLAAPALAEPPQKNQDADALAARVDQLFAARWDANKVKPAPIADDAEFMRRLYLDLAGTIPPVSDVRAFLADTSPDKRRKLIDKLLNSPDYVNHFADVWTATWMPDLSDPQFIGLQDNFKVWLLARLRENASYDSMAREILTSAAPQPVGRPDGLETVQPNGGVSPAAFYIAYENKPEKLAGATSRLFLAVRLECAQCHDSKFDTWTRKQFWQYAAFFGAGAGRNSKPSIVIPSLGTVVEARFPDGTDPKFTNGASPRTVLADWAVSPDNKYFARAGVNRVWSLFFGVGLVEPVDDLTRDKEKNEVLDELARQFADHHFDLKFLIRAIVSTRAYQLTSRQTDPSQDDPRFFARMAVKALSTEQVIASLKEATHLKFDSPAPFVLRSELGGSFARQPNKPTEFQTSIPQALALMNGKFVDDSTAVEGSALLASARAPFFGDAKSRVELLYLAALSRKPTDAESAKLVAYVDKGGPSGDPNLALADVFWALLNSSEFVFNH
ncbi:MAG TPA: DUF1549 and DUF1553 domain-containing protein [Gemmataceae bacterium]|nr:DUF1549 and DUF1553 domain-containing protein [Gemmataceae bacterium]